MVRQRQEGTEPELELRSALHRLGLRFRVHIPPLEDKRRRADIVFPSARVAVFVDGCYWHGCPEHGTEPKSNSQWWRRKLADNKHRDADTDTRLTHAGWAVIRVWEHENPVEAARRVAAVVESRR